MKSKKAVTVGGLLLFSLLFTYFFITNIAAARTMPEPEAIQASFPVIADFEGGAPPDWFVYNGGGSSVSPTFITITGTGGVLSVTYDVTDFGGFGALFNPGQDWSGYDAIRLDFYGNNSGLSYAVEVQDGTGAVVERFQAFFVDDFTGWQQIVIPFSTFVRGGFQDPGAPNDGFQLTNIAAWVVPLPIGSSDFLLDNLVLANLVTFADFEAGAPPDWYQYNGGGSSVTPGFVTISDTHPYAVPGQVGSNGILSGTYNVTDFGGFGALFATSLDWSSLEGVSFWFYGDNTGATYTFEAQDGTPGNSVVERFQATFVDDFTGWRHVALPFATFFRGGFQDPGAPNDGFNLIDMRAWAFPLPAQNGRFVIDYMAAYGDASAAVLQAQFDASGYSGDEGAPITLTVSLNLTSTNVVTVTYATADGTATSADYMPVSGTVTFAPGETAQDIVIMTVDDGELEDDETLTVQLSNPVSATLGTRDVATVTIIDNEQVTPGSAKLQIVDDYELTQLVTGTDGTAPIGWLTFNAPTASSAITLTPVSTSGVPAPIPGVAPSTVLQMDTDVNSGEFAGFVHAFEDANATMWTPQDWSSYEGVAFWLYGNNTGGTLFLDILDNRNPGSTSDDAERFSIDIPDDFSGWQYFEIPFIDFNRKDIGNGAPNDGFTLTEVHGYAFGAFGSVNMGAQTNYVENFALLVRVDIVDDYELTQLITGTDGTAPIGWVTFNAPTAASAITLTQVSTTAPPAPIPGLAPSTVLQMDTDVNSGEFAGFVHAFEDATATTWTPQDWSTYEGVCFWLYGNNTGGTLFLDVLDNRNPGSTSDDAERWSIDIPDDFSGWQFFVIPFDDLNRKEIGNGAPNDGLTLTEVHGYAFGAFGSVNMGAQTNYVENFAVYGNIGGGGQALEVAFDRSQYDVVEGDTAVVTVTLNITSTTPVSVTYATAESYATPDRDFVPVSGTLVIPSGALSGTFTVDTIDDGKYEGDENLMLVLSNPISTTLGFQYRAVLNIVDDETADPALVHDFEGYHSFAVTGTGTVTLSITELMSGTALAIPGQGTYENVLTIDYDTTSGPANLTETFVQGTDWSAYEGLSFWYYGTGSSETVTVNLLDNQVTTTANLTPTDWVMVWSDEFDDPAGTPPNPNVWKHEIGDGTLNGIPGWGNSESQYYSDSTDNAATDGSGNLAITMQKVNTQTTNLACWYGPCEYTSARLISADRKEFEYGRVEARFKVPDGGDGLWPAFWMLGTDIDQVGWPQCGEIDIMEYVSRIPHEIFGTIHGPGYSGGNSFGNTYDFGVPVSQTFHTIAIEWSPDLIHWYVDGFQFHTATPADVAPNEWVYNHPFYMILNLAIGGNFGGAIDPGIPFPQTYLVDYVRVYQGVNTSERFEASFVDDFTGWQQVAIPFADFIRSANQPPGAPNDGLTLTETWGYGFTLPGNSSGLTHLDRIYLETNIPDVAPTGLTLQGPSVGLVDVSQTFTATVSPMTTTTPLTFTWVAEGQTPVVQVVNGLQDTVSFTWAVTGTYAVTVTASNSAGTVSDSQTITVNAPDAAPATVNLAGPASGFVSATQTFTATVSPMTTTTPLTFTWTADGQSPVVNVLNGLQDSVSFAWPTAGTYTVTVTVSNSAGTVSDTYTIVINDLPEVEYTQFLPVVFNPQP